MAQEMTEVTKLYSELIENFNKTSEIDNKIFKKLEIKIKELKNEELVKEFNEIISELNGEQDQDKDAAGNRMASHLTKSTLIKRKRKLKFKLDDLGRILARFLPGFECLIETEYVKEVKEYKNGVDEEENVDDGSDEYKPVKSAE
jgi:hypothetical protein